MTSSISLLEEEHCHEDDRDEHRVVHGMVRRAALNAALEVLVGEPQAADADCDCCADGDEHDEVSEPEANASDEPLSPAMRTFTVLLLFRLGERGQCENQHGQEDERVPLPLKSRES